MLALLACHTERFIALNIIISRFRHNVFYARLQFLVCSKCINYIKPRITTINLPIRIRYKNKTGSHHSILSCLISFIITRKVISQAQREIKNSSFFWNGHIPKVFCWAVQYYGILLCDISVQRVSSRFGPILSST